MADFGNLRLLMFFARAGIAVAAVALLAPAFAQKPPLTHDVYDEWESIRSRQISHDGQWVIYSVNPQVGDGTFYAKRLDGSVTHEIERGTGFRMTDDSKFVVMTVLPTWESREEARIKKVKAEDRPKNELAVLNLQTGDVWRKERVAQWSMAPKSGGWFAYRLEPPKGEQKPKREKGDKKANHNAGNTWMFRHTDNTEFTMDSVSNVTWHEDGEKAALVISTNDPNGDGDGLMWLDVANQKQSWIVEQLGRYGRVTIHHDTGKIAFSSDKDTYKEDKQYQAIYLWSGSGAPRLIANNEEGTMEGWIVPTGGGLRFSESGKRLTFPTQPERAPAPKDDDPSDNVSVDIWHWRDPQIQPQQLLRANAERNRTFDAMYENGRIKQLEMPEMPNVAVSDRGDGRFASAGDGEPYAVQATWGDYRNDFYVIDLQTNRREKIREAAVGGASLSPTGTYAVWLDPEKGQYFARHNITKRTVRIDEGVDATLLDELMDRPYFPNGYGFAGWTDDEDWILVYDRYDIWALDPDGRDEPINMTAGAGRRYQTRYRLTNIDPEQRFWTPGQTAYVTLFNERTKESGYGTMTIGKPNWPNELVMMDMSVGGMQKARDTSDIVYTRQTFTEPANIWSSTLAMQSHKKLTEINEQQDQYNWGTAELIDWISTDGIPLQGILVLPEDFDPGKDYPMISYFYERSSDGIHRYRSPAPSASTINWPLFASNGYVIFIPDIPYKDGYPGESAMNAILPGINKVIEMGFVDKDRIGIQGQSWGGYQVTYMVTETDMFAAAWAGAPVSNMFSAYGGVRWGSGLFRQMQYEMGQSRLGGSIWEKPLRYLENSPLFFADKINTPLAIMHNDKDGAVPWYQGIEMFSALRRLEKPSWLIVYNNEDHNLVQRKNRKDLSIRLSQFFDHYLKGAPAPVWMTKGVPAVDKGRTMGTEIPEMKAGGGK